MLKTSDLAFIFLVLCVATATYAIKYNSANESARLADLRSQISSQNEAIDILKADWSLLTSPSRLQKLVERYGKELRLQSITPHQITTVEALPLRPVISVEERLALERQRKLQENGISGLITGSVGNPKPSVKAGE